MSRAWNSAWHRVFYWYYLRFFVEHRKKLKFIFNYRLSDQSVDREIKPVLVFPAGLPCWPFVSHSSLSHLQLTLYLRAASNSFSTGSFRLHLGIAWSTEHRVLWVIYNFQTMQRSNENNFPNPNSQLIQTLWSNSFYVRMYPPRVLMHFKVDVRVTPIWGLRFLNILKQKYQDIRRIGNICDYRFKTKFYILHLHSYHPSTSSPAKQLREAHT